MIEGTQQRCKVIVETAAREYPKPSDFDMLPQKIKNL